MSDRCCVDPGAKQSHNWQGAEETISGLSTYKTGEGKSVIVIFTDIFGYSFINTRKMANTFAEATSTTVLIPDFFNGDPLDPIYWNNCLHDQYDSIQIIGFCYGAKQVVHLIIDPELCSMVKAAAVAHPTFLVNEEAEKIKRPILFLCAETDTSFPLDMREHFETILSPTGLATFIDYPGTVHGFVTRPSHSEQAIQQRDKAVQDAIQFFKKHL